MDWNNINQGGVVVYQITGIVYPNIQLSTFKEKC